ncbi:MAG: FtsX-like permease family protein, partial [Acidobacteriota bacterium]
TSILVGQGLADVRFLGLGDRLPIKMNNGELFAPRVAGIFVAPSALLTNDLVVMPTDQLRSVFGFGAEECTDIAVEVPQTSEIATVTRKIYEAWPDVRVVSREQIRHTYEAIFDWRGGLWLAVLIGTIAAFAVLVWDKATGLSAEEYRTIGLLKAVGWTTRDVLELKACEGSIVSLVSVLSGLLLAQLHLIWLDGALFAHVLKGWSVQFPPFDIAPRLDAYTLLVCLPLAVVPYVAAGLVPAWRTAIIDPDSVIRS